ncbi:MAG: DUF2075 domain-containing protein [Gemmatimonadales bacterium]
MSGDSAGSDPGQPPAQLAGARSAAYVTLPIDRFVRETDHAILGGLTAASTFSIDLNQRAAWEASLPILKKAVAGLAGQVFLEFDIPRLGSRIDAVVVSGPAIFPIELKVGERRYTRDAINQAWDYALDLKNFHRASHGQPVLPILVATAAATGDHTWRPPHADGVRPPFCTNDAELGQAIRLGLESALGPPIDTDAWGRSAYQPTPTIVQAARALYAQHSVDSIARNDAGARNLAVTSRRVEEVVDEARRDGSKAIVFVTGVPGAGKTLVGLNIATRRRDEASPTHAVFLSGNGPLVAVLREALVRDEYQRQRTEGAKVRKGTVAQGVKAFIQNVHHFRDDGLRDAEAAPADHVVIFDEAQRAWNLGKTSDFMRRRKGRPGFDQSEPQFLISYLDRHPDWAVVVCLVGGGQEIHTGEAGIGAWLEAVRDHFPHWRVYLSPRLSDSEYSAEPLVASFGGSRHVSHEADLHLNVSMRSFRSERVSEFVRLVLDREVADAREVLRTVATKYPVVLTRDLARAKAWVRSQARGTERYGVVASSQAMRLKPLAIDVRVDVDPVKWFLNDAADTRSSYYLEDAATEFQIQGLELDWTCVTWDADLRLTPAGWSFHQFRGDRWVRCKAADRQRYMVNAYRVLLTRARQGMAIFVPTGDPLDPTRAPDFYDGTHRYLADLGIPSIDG